MLIIFNATKSEVRFIGEGCIDGLVVTNVEQVLTHVEPHLPVKLLQGFRVELEVGVIQSILQS